MSIRFIFVELSTVCLTVQILSVQKKKNYVTSKNPEKGN